MKTFKLTDGEIAAVINAIYQRYEELENTSVNNPILKASLSNEFKDLKSVCAKLEN